MTFVPHRIEERQGPFPARAAGAAATQDASAQATPRDERQHSYQDGYWKAWLLPSVLGGLVALAASMPRSSIARLLSLVGQLSIMSVLVYRSSETARDPRYQTPVQNVLRAVLGSIFLGTAEVAAMRMGWSYFVSFESPCSLAGLAVGAFGAVMLTSARALFVYAACALSDYMFHRFVWHAHWAKTTKSPLLFAVRRHYVQHYLGHHLHAHDAGTIKKLAELSENPMSDARKPTIELGSSMSREDVHVLWCSNHGLTVGVESDDRVTFSMKWGCRLHTALMLLAMPCGTAALVNAVHGSFLGMLCHCASSAFTVYITFHHDKYHADAEKRIHWAETRYDPSRGSRVERVLSRIGHALWLSSEMDRITKDHKKHHHCPEHREEYYGLVPYSRFFVYPMWQSW